MAVESMAGARSVTVAELHDMYWIRIGAGDLDPEASWDVRYACLRALERGITDIVVELTGVEHVSAEGVDMLEAAAEELRAKHGTLSLVVKHDESVGRIDLRLVPAAGLSELTGLSAALDEALIDGGRVGRSSQPTPTEGGNHER
jgi:anti-anti-sigma factor